MEDFMTKKQKAILGGLGAAILLLLAGLACLVLSTWPSYRQAAAGAPTINGSSLAAGAISSPTATATLPLAANPPQITPSPGIVVQLLPTLTALSTTTPGNLEAAIPLKLDPAALASHTPGPTPTSMQGMSNVYVEFILDASDKMTEPLAGGRSKAQAAGDLLRQNLMTYRPETNVGLRVYGHRLPASSGKVACCQDIELIAPLAPGYQGEIATWLQSYQPRGLSPLANAITQAVMDFVLVPDRVNAAVLITAGMDSCQGDPCMVSNIFQQAGVNLQVHIVGLGVDDTTRQQLKCTAQGLRGAYYDANNEDDLKRILEIIRKAVEAPGKIIPAPVKTPASTPYPPDNDRDKNVRPGVGGKG